MANTYKYIASNTLSSATNTVTFSSIPATFNDLVLLTSVRNSTSGTQNYFLKMNSVTTAYDVTILYGDGTSPQSVGYTNESSGYRVFQAQPGTNYPANTFSSTEIYIPKYKDATAKPLLMHNITEANFSAAYTSFVSGYQPATAAIDTLTITTAATFVVGSSFYLYGIKNS